MKKVGSSRSLTVGILILVICAGCVNPFYKYRPRTLAEKTLDEMYFITTPEQRDKILDLGTEQEIGKFLDAFWSTYDPDPTTDVNELRQIYYNRVKYADENFSESGRSGCKTDRGRIFILYGPPAEITYNNFVQADTFGDIARNEQVKDKWRWENDREIFKTSFSNSYQIWHYDIPGLARKTINSLDFRNLKGVVFVFADLDGIGIYTQIYSTVASEVDDARIYHY